MIEGQIKGKIKERFVTLKKCSTRSFVSLSSVQFRSIQLASYDAISLP
jgi:hypothetical protein